MTEISKDLDQAQARLREQMRSPYLTVPEVAEFARCEQKAVRGAIHRGVLQAFAPNRKLLIREEDARAWVESRPAPGGSSRPRRPKPKRAQGPGLGRCAAGDSAGPDPWLG
jgi:excisionase family DNA binding protein